MQAKIFDGRNGREIERELNRFLDEHRDIKIEHMAQSEACDDKEQVWNVTLTLLYSVKQ